MEVIFAGSKQDLETFLKSAIATTKCENKPFEARYLLMFTQNHTIKILLKNTGMKWLFCTTT